MENLYIKRGYLNLQISFFNLGYCPKIRDFASSEPSFLGKENEKWGDSYERENLPVSVSHLLPYA